jgi:AraC-like DNA-binding protein
MQSVPQTPKTAFARYLPTEPDDLEWGLHVIDAGHTEIQAGQSYPPGGMHPEGYMFTWERGRRLTEYQLVYITHGEGVLEIRGRDPFRLVEGMAFLLLPGQWHRYRPNSSTGWNEHWIGFDGEVARRIVPRFFHPGQPVLATGLDEELLHLFCSVQELMQTSQPGCRQMMSANTLACLARARGLALRTGAPPDAHEQKIQKARNHLLEHATADVDLRALAESLGYSYSRFRNLFKEKTGLAPGQFQLQIRINLACDLLTNDTRSIGEIADHLGFSSLYYFSRLFKQKLRVTPSAYRARHSAQRHREH